MKFMKKSLCEQKRDLLNYFAMQVEAALMKAFYCGRESWIANIVIGSGIDERS